MTNTIVTACNRRYLWGAILLISSIRLNNGRTPIHIWTSQLTSEEEDILTQFDDVKVISTEHPHPHLIKPRAMLNVDTEYATWIDCDCMFVGHLDPLLLPHNEGIQIRFRAKTENAQVFKKRYEKHDQVGMIPKRILSQWQRDVNEEHDARFKNQCVSNYISVHRKHFGLIERWQEQLKSVAIQSDHPIDSQSPAYFMTDESVFASLLIFSRKIPTISPYRLNCYPNQKLIHFGQQLKPWETWRFNHLSYYDYVLTTIDTLQRQGYCLPPVPDSLKIQNRKITYFKSFLSTGICTLKSACRSIVHKACLQQCFARN